MNIPAPSQICLSPLQRMLTRDPGDEKAKLLCICVGLDETMVEEGLAHCNSNSSSSDWSGRRRLKLL